MNDSKPIASRFDHLLNFRLWRLLSLSSAPVLRLCEGRYGVSRREWAVLAMVAQEPDGLAPSQIGEAAGIDRAQVSRTCEKLQAKHLVERLSVRGDGRRVRIRLSERGQALYMEISAQVDEINKRLVSALDEDSQRMFNRALEQLTERAARVNCEMLRDVRVNRSRASDSRRR